MIHLFEMTSDLKYYLYLLISDECFTCAEISGVKKCPFTYLFLLMAGPHLWIGSKTICLMDRTSQMNRCTEPKLRYVSIMIPLMIQPGTFAAVPLLDKKNIYLVTSTAMNSISWYVISCYSPTWLLEHLYRLYLPYLYPMICYILLFTYLVTGVSPSLIFQSYLYSDISSSTK